MEGRYWEDNGHPTAKYDNYNPNDGFGRSGELNFAAQSEDEAEYAPNAYLKKGNVSKQNPMSHRIIEKRRRDRMNNCLADLSRLIPPEYLKKGRGRVEKTEIIEMAIRHVKFLQDRATGLYKGTNADLNVAERPDGFLSGYQEASAEAVRYLIEVQGYGPGDGLCVQMAAHLHRNCEHFIQAECRQPFPMNHQPPHPSGNSSETTTSSSSSNAFVKSVIAQAPPPYQPEHYEPERTDVGYAMDCDRDSSIQVPMPTEHDTLHDEDEPLPLDGRRTGEPTLRAVRGEPTLRAVRKPELADDFLQSYKFKNSIERRFSRSLDEDTSSESPHHLSIDKPAATQQYVPVFALNTLGKYYVPLSVDYSCLARHLGPYDVLDARAAHHAAPLHPVTINVNFQPCINYHVKKEPNDRDWRAA